MFNIQISEKSLHFARKKNVLQIKSYVLNEIDSKQLKS